MPLLQIIPTLEHNPSATPNIEGQYPIQIVMGSLIPVTDCCEELTYTSDGGIGIPDGEGGFNPLPSQPLPAIAGDNKACDAAASAVQVYLTLHQEILNRFDAGLTFITIATAIATTLLILIAVPFAWIAIFEIITLAAGVLAVITTSDFDATVQDELKCIFFCAATENEDGTVTFDFAEVVSQVEEKAVALDMWRAIQYYLSITGSDGLNRAGATGVVSGAECDCEDCPYEWCYEWNQSELESAWTSVFGGAQGTRYVYFSLAFSETNITQIYFEYEWNGLGEGAESARAIWEGYNFSGDQIAISDDLTPLACVWDGSADMDGVTLGVNCEVGSGGIVTITKIRLKGFNSVNPFGTDNCEE